MASHVLSDLTIYPRIQLSDAEKDFVFRLVAALTGSEHEGVSNMRVLIANVVRRMIATRHPTLVDYLTFIDKNTEEFERFISALAIHTTSWFREVPHFRFLERYLRKNLKMWQGQTFKLLSAACSTGQEAYSFALVLEAFRNESLTFDYSVEGRDLDLVALELARKAIYPRKGLQDIDLKYRFGLLLGSGKYRDYMVPTEPIRQRCQFSRSNLLQPIYQRNAKYDFIVCRNVLIYFSDDQIATIVQNLLQILTDDGLLCLGHSEALNPTRFGLKTVGSAIYSRRPKTSGQLGSKSVTTSPATNTRAKVKILIVDDSPTIRAIAKGLFDKHGFETVVAKSAAEASECIKRHRFDVISLDQRMPGETGISWLKRQRQTGLDTPTIIVSDIDESDAVELLQDLKNGAQDFIPKSILNTNPEALIECVTELVEASNARRSDTGTSSRIVTVSRTEQRKPDLILIGASTGGPEAICRLLANMPPTSPPIVVVQHIHVSFARPLGARISSISGLKLGEIGNASVLKLGHLYLALGDYHLGVESAGTRTQLFVSQDPHVGRHRPSIDFLFRSALHLRKHVSAVLLTGMGSDGAAGMKLLKEKGSTTYAQDRGSCIVYGMPKVAAAMDAVCYIANPDRIRDMLIKSLQ